MEISDFATDKDVIAVRDILTGGRGKLRVGINLGNRLLVSARGTQGEARGVAPELSHMLATSLSVDAELVPYDHPAKLMEDASGGVWDIAFLADEPQRADQIAFSKPYAMLEATYVVRHEYLFQDASSMDTNGVRIGLSPGTAYWLWLERNLKRATLVPVNSTAEAYDRLRDQSIDAVAGLRARMLADVRDDSSIGLVDGNFYTVKQAIASTSREPVVHSYLDAFVAHLTEHDIVAKLSQKYGVEGLSSV